MTNRIIGTSAANMYGQLVTMFIAIISVPVFLSIWTIEEYGVWVLIFTIPAYMAIMDFGVGTISINRMLMLRSNAAKVSVEYSAALFLLVAISFSLLVLLICSFSILNFFGVLSSEVYFSLLLITCYSTLLLVYPLIDAPFKIAEYFATSALLSNTLRLIEMCVCLVVVLEYKTYLSAAAALFASRFIMLLITVVIMAKKEMFPRVVLTVDFKRVRKLLSESCRFVWIPLGNLLYLQAGLFALSLIAGPSSVAIFSVYRTISRTMVQFYNVINRGFMPEFTICYGDGNLVRLRRLLRLSVNINCIVSVASGCFLYVFFEEIIYYWAGEEFVFDRMLSVLIIISTMLSGLWQVGWNFLISVNKYFLVGLGYFSLTLVSLLLLALFYQFGELRGVAFSYVFVDSLLVLWVLYCVNRVVSEK